MRTYIQPTIKMKKHLLLTLLLAAGLFSRAAAQQVPLYSQYYYNPFLYNPAMAGHRDYGEAFAIMRKQWTGVADAPQTRAFTIDGPIKLQKIGLGFAAYDDVTGIFERMGVNVSYSYRLNFAKDHYLALGLALGMLDNRIDFTKVIVHDQQDQSILSNYYRRMTFDGTFGLSYKLNHLELGMAIPELTAPKIDYANNTASVYYGVARHFIGMAKYSIMFGDDNLRLEPMVYAQYAPGAPMLLDGSLMFYYKNKAWIGLMYRDQFAITAAAGVKLNDRIVLGYSYDWTTSRIAPYAGGTHEVMLGFTFGNNAHKDRTEEILDRLDKHDQVLERHEQRLDSIKNVAKEHETRIDTAEHKIRRIEEDIKDFEQFKKDMQQDSTGAGAEQGNGNSGTGNNSSTGNNGQGNNGVNNNAGKDNGSNENTGNNENSGNNTNGTGNAAQGNKGHSGAVVSPKGGNRNAAGVESHNHLKIGDKYILDNIYFAKENEELLPSSYEQLNELADVLIHNPNMKIAVEGFADATGPATYNNQLSLQRAEAVKRYLVMQGAPAGQIVARGKGEQKPIGDNTTAEGRKMNRRVEMVILSK